MLQPKYKYKKNFTIKKVTGTYFVYVVNMFIVLIVEHD